MLNNQKSLILIKSFISPFLKIVFKKNLIINHMTFLFYISAAF